MHRYSLHYDEGRIAEFESRGIRCPRCGDFLDLVGDVHREIFLCPNCGYYEENCVMEEDLVSSKI